jgi:serine protease Do
MPVVVRVWRESPAAIGGLRTGDRILTIDGARIASQDDMISRLGTAGDRVTIDVERRGRVARLTFDQPSSR